MESVCNVHSCLLSCQLFTPEAKIVRVPCLLYLLLSVVVGSGDVHSVGAGRGKFHCVNVPLRDGVRDDQYEEIFKR